MKKVITANEAEETFEIVTFGKVRVMYCGEIKNRIAFADECGDLWVRMFNCYVRTNGNVSDTCKNGVVMVYPGATCASSK